MMTRPLGLIVKYFTVNWLRICTGRHAGSIWLSLACVASLSSIRGIAAESTSPLPSESSKPAPGQMAMGRPDSLGANNDLFLDVEVFNVRPHDPTGVALWAELAGQGFHVVAAVPQPDGTATLYLERMGGLHGEPPRLPSLIEQDAVAAAILRAKLQAGHAERERVVPAAPVSAQPPADVKKP